MADTREGNLVIRFVFLLAVAALIFASIAMALPFWSQKGDVRYGLWSMCISGTWNTYQVEFCTPVVNQGECQGLYDSSRAFAILGIIFIVITILTSFAMIRHRKIKGYKLTCFSWGLCIACALAVLFTILCWVLWLAFVESTCNGQPKIQNYGAPWILEIVSSGLMLIAALLSCAGGYMIAVSPKALWKRAQEQAVVAEGGTVAMTGSVHEEEDEDPWAQASHASHPSHNAPSQAQPQQIRSKTTAKVPTYAPNQYAASFQQSFPPPPFQQSYPQQQYQAAYPQQQYSAGYNVQGQYQVANMEQLPPVGSHYMVQQPDSQYYGEEF